MITRRYYFILNKSIYLSIFLMALFHLAKGQKKNSSTPNFILISCDNLGYGDIGPFGSEINRTPNLDKMAKEGRRFTHFYSTSGVCTPSRASLMTGCYAQRIGLAWNERDGQVLRPVSPYGLNPGEITVAEILKDAGYATGLIGKWHLGDQLPFLPTRQGFDYFYGIPYSDDMTKKLGEQTGKRYGATEWPDLPLMWNEKVLIEGVDRNNLTKDYTEKALDFIQQHHKEHFFLYLAQAMPGSTTKPFSSEAFRGKSKSGPWGDSIEELDWSVGQIMEKLKILGIAENTLLIFTSDNGAPMGNNMNSMERGTNRPLSGRGYTTAEGGFRIPLLMWWPGTILKASACSELATTMDILPTFSYLAGRNIPDDRILDGHNIWPLIAGLPGSKSPYEAFYYYEQTQLQAVRSGAWKLFVPLDSFQTHPHFVKGQAPEFLLYNVVEDISSERNVAKDNPLIVKKLMEYVEKARCDLGDLNKPGRNVRSCGRVDHPVPVTQIH
mgnify:CR=1 FL=1